jgi:hypothetical protein
MLERKQKINALEKHLEAKDFTKVKKWQKMDGHDTALTFPFLSKDDMKTITVGTFHIKQATSYVNEHIDDDGQYEVWISTEENGLLLASIQSKHSNRKQYYAIIRYDKISVKEWCCQCPNGNNTIGCCSHVCSIIWFEGVARHEQKQQKRSSINFTGYLNDASAIYSSDENTTDDEDTLYELVD